jgi:hypothetical protein
MISPLRQKMIEDMQLNGLALGTQEVYQLDVRQPAKHYHKSPDQINEEELRQYFLFLKNDKHAARSTCTFALCRIKFSRFCSAAINSIYKFLIIVNTITRSSPTQFSLEKIKFMFLNFFTARAGRE